MQEEHKEFNWKILIYLSPVYVVLGMLLFKWSMKVNSSDLDLSKDEYNAFNASEGEIKKRQNTGYDPNFTDSGYTVRYRSGKEAPRSLRDEEEDQRSAAQTERNAAARRAQEERTRAAGGSSDRSANQASLESNDTRAKEQMGLGNKMGYLSYAVGKAMNNPKAVSALLNNKYIVGGFMARGTVKAATGSPQGLANYLKSGAPVNFMNNPVVKAALDNPAIVSAFASSSLASAMLNTPAAQALMKDPQALGDLVNSNPQLIALAMQNPQTLSTLMNNPDVSGIVGKFDTSGIKKY